MEHKKSRILVYIICLLLLLLFLLHLLKQPMNLTINGTFRGSYGNTTQMTFIETDSTYYTYFQSQPTASENHGSFRKISEDLYIMQDGAFDGKLIRLYPDYMELIDLQGTVDPICFDKVSDVPIIL